jgi:hypothetical protein
MQVFTGDAATGRAGLFSCACSATAMSEQQVGSRTDHWQESQLSERHRLRGGKSSPEAMAMQREKLACGVRREVAHEIEIELLE